MAALIRFSTMTAPQRALERRAGLQLAVGLIAHFEGGLSADGKYHAYWDRDGKVWTIGHGDTQNVKPGMVWTRRKADRMLRRRLSRDYAPALWALDLPMKRHMIAATLSLMWNLGAGIIGPSHDIGVHLRAHHWRTAAASFDEYVNSGGRFMQGLQNRRDAEQAVFLMDLISS